MRRVPQALGAAQPTTEQPLSGIGGSAPPRAMPPQGGAARPNNPTVNEGGGVPSSPASGPPPATVSRPPSQMRPMGQQAQAGAGQGNVTAVGQSPNTAAAADAARYARVGAALTGRTIGSPLESLMGQAGQRPGFAQGSASGQAPGQVGASRGYSLSQQPAESRLMGRITDQITGGGAQAPADAQAPGGIGTSSRAMTADGEPPEEQGQPTGPTPDDIRRILDAYGYTERDGIYVQKYRVNDDGSIFNQETGEYMGNVNDPSSLRGDVATLVQNRTPNADQLAQQEEARAAREAGRAQAERENRKDEVAAAESRTGALTDNANIAEQTGLTEEGVQSLRDQGYIFVSGPGGVMVDKVGDGQDPMLLQQFKSSDAYAAAARRGQSQGGEGTFEGFMQEAQASLQDWPEMGEDELMAQVDAYKASQAQAQSRALAAYMERGSRAGATPGQFSGTMAQMQHNGKIAEAQTEAAMRWDFANKQHQNRVNKFTAAVQLAENAAARAASAEEAQKIREWQAQMMFLAQEAQKQWIQWQEEHNKPSVGETFLNHVAQGGAAAGAVVGGIFGGPGGAQAGAQAGGFIGGGLADWGAHAGIGDVGR